MCDICRGGGHIVQNCPEPGRCKNSCELGHLACDCTNRPNAWQTVNQDADTPSVASDPTPTPVEAAGASGAGRPSARPAFSPSVSTGIGADLVTGSLSWGDQMDLADNELSPFSASESDSSLGFHVSPSLNMPSCGNKEKDSNQMNDMDSNDMNIIDSNGSDKSISNMVMRNLNSSQNDDNGNLSLSQNDYSNSQSILSDRNESYVTCVSNAPSGSSGRDSGPAKDAGVTTDASILGKRAISEVVTHGESSGKGAAPAPKKDSGSRSKKAASTEVKKGSSESKKAASSGSLLFFTSFALIYIMLTFLSLNINDLRDQSKQAGIMQWLQS